MRYIFILVTIGYTTHHTVMFLNESGCHVEYPSQFFTVLIDLWSLLRMNLSIVMKHTSDTNSKIDNS